MAAVPEKPKENLIMARQPGYSPEQYETYIKARTEKGMSAKDAAAEIGLANFQSIEKKAKNEGRIPTKPRGVRTAKATTSRAAPPPVDSEAVLNAMNVFQDLARSQEKFKQDAISSIEFAVLQINRLKDEADKIISNLEARQKEIMGVKDEGEPDGTDGSK